MKKITKISTIVLCFSMLALSCKKAIVSNNENENLQPIENVKIVNDISTNVSSERLSSTQWDVQALGNTYAFTDNVSGRYSNDGSTLNMKVYADDPKTSSNTKYARTELRGLKEFKGNTSHSMYVTMDVTQTGGKVIIAQIFDETDGDDQNAILYHDGKIYARSSSDVEYYLSDLPSGYFNFSITVTSNNITLTANGHSKSFSTTNHNCYFKTGVYLNSTSGSASCKITSLSQS
jgi:hypothetical protein